MNNSSGFRPQRPLRDRRPERSERKLAIPPRVSAGCPWKSRLTGCSSGGYHNAGAEHRGGAPPRGARGSFRAAPPVPRHALARPRPSRRPRDSREHSGGLLGRRS